MANQIILPAQTIPAQDLVNSISGKIKKIFFQCEIKSIAANNVTVGIIAYAARKNSSQQWEIGTKVTAAVDNTKPPKPFSLPLGIGNCEWTVTKITKKRKGETLKEMAERAEQVAVIKKLNKIAKDKPALKNSSLTFKAKKSDNPHIEFTVTLDSGTGTLTATAKPSPPAPPEA